MTSRRDLPALPLGCATPAEWALQALEQPLALLNDHAHLEKKAATTALELLSRWPEPHAPENWVRALTSLARDEVDHLALVSRLLSRRGGCLTKHHRSPYAAALRAQVRLGSGPAELLDRLMVASLIEARSRERFALLAPACAAGADPELAELYRGLVAADLGHHRVYLDLARQVAPAKVVRARWQEWLGAEVQVMRAQTPGPRIHSWPGDSAD